MMTANDTKSRPTIFRYLAFLTACLLLAASAGVWASSGKVVGQVTFSLGAPLMVEGGHAAHVAKPGDSVHAGDRIVTAEGQHVHLRFVDGGYLSVRPGSRLVIDSYNVDAERPAIRFKLEYGVVRSITGRAAQAHKDRFRLDTPVAAIGVRGTDFVVLADQDSLRAVVNRGAIVVAPYDTGCEANTFGPCSTAAARELADNMGRVLLELSATQPARIVPVDAATQQRIAPANSEPAPGAALQTAVETVSARQSGSLEETSRVISAPSETQVQQPGHLQWGRWSAAVRPGDTLSVDYAQATQDRSVTVGNDYAGLFRQAGSSPILSTQLGNADFRLASGNVVLQQTDGSVSAGSISSGWLHIDFSQRQYATGLIVDHVLTGAVSLQSAGRVRDDGVFAVTSGDTHVAGAVSYDGTEAGYLFDKSVVQGTLSGITLWKR